MRSYNRTASAFTLCIAAALGLLASAFGPAAARAQQPAPPTASVLRTSVSGAVDPSLAEAVDRLVRSQLDAAEVLRITGSVSLDLHDVQLALGCIGETDACLEAAAGEIGVDALVLPSLVRTGDETVLSIGLFDRRATPKVRRVTGRVRGADPSTGTLEAVSGLLAQLFPQAHFDAEGHGAGGAGGGGGGHAGGGGPGPGPGHGGARGGLSPWPFVVGGVGVAVLGAGVGFGLAAQSAEDDFAALPTSTADEIDVFLARVEDARFDATVANVLFVTGGLAVAGGVAWAVIELTSGGGGEHDVGSGGAGGRARARAQLVPVITPGGVGVVLGGVL